MNNKQDGFYIDYESQIMISVQNIRRRPGMYIGSTGERGLHHLIEGLLDFSLFKNNNDIEITLQDNNISYCDRDYNPSSDVTQHTQKSFLEIMLSESVDNLATIKNLIAIDNHALVIVNALSEKLEVSIYKDNKKYYQKYEKSKPVSQIKESKNNNGFKGISITFEPDRDIFQENTINQSILKIRLQQLAYLNQGLKIDLKNNLNNMEKRDSYYYPQGMSEYLLETNQSASLINNEIIRVKHKQDNISFEVAFLWRIVSEDHLLKTFVGAASYQRQWILHGNKQEKLYNSLRLMSFVNQQYTLDGGTHVEGLKEGIVQGIKTALKQSDYTQKPKLEWRRVSQGLIGIVSVILDKPDFAGSTKWELTNPEVVEVISKPTSSVLAKYLQKNTEIIKEIV